MFGRAAVALSVVAWLAGCTVDVQPTEVMVVVDATDAVKARTITLETDIAAADTRDGPFTGNVHAVYGPGLAAISFPRRIGLVPRNDDAHRVFQLRAVAADASGAVASALVRSTYVEHRLVELRIVLDSTPCTPACTGADTCREGRCVPIFVDPGTLPTFDAGPDAPAPTDLGPPDADGGADTGPIDLGMPDLQSCTADRECADTNLCNGDEKCDHGSCVPGTPVSCDDHVGCTEDHCDPATGHCATVPMDALCTIEPGGHCDPVTDCQYPTCSSRTCIGSVLLCETAICVSATTCVRSSACGAGTFCCAGTCEPIGCDDGNPCTLDACSLTGCLHAPAPPSSPCSDGNDCTSGDQCVSGECQPFLVFGNGAPCDNGDGCPGDVCVASRCMSCDDSNACTLETCMGTTCTTMVPPPEGTPCLSEVDCTPGTCSAGVCVSSGSAPACFGDDLCCFGRCQPFCS